ncbi:MAG: anhydro-N-acetylmuramic acid kinase [Elusimicrobia bacterium]|nr:anhydro-N-acetylmuramic acid kinase [Elusimicrobiota bacterium]
MPIEIVAYKTYPYPRDLRKRVLSAINLKTPEISRLNFELGEFFAQSALRLIREPRTLNPEPRISVIGSHGQTIYHGPNDKPPNTLQIGEPAVIAHRTGLPVVADFRPMDMAAGGQGAPLVPFFDWYCFKHIAPAALLNIGGIANVTIIVDGRGRQGEGVIAFDTGPGNCLMDLAVNLATKGRLSYDRDGKLAGQGQIDWKAVNRALEHAYFKRKPPKSTGRELFNEEFLCRYFAPSFPHSLNPLLPFLLATLAAFTAETISLAFRKFIIPSFPHSLIPSIPVLLSGGGAKNKFLMKLLEQKLSPLTIRLIDDFGIPSEAKEAAAFALMAYQAILGRPNHLPRTTGAQGKPLILGKIINPSLAGGVYYLG